MTSAMSRLILVRHGETVGNSSIRYYGRTDIELSESGRAQMRATRQILATDLNLSRFTQVFASPLRRAIEGARIIAGDGIGLIEIEEFREIDFGDFEGLTAGEIEWRYPAEYSRWMRDRLSADYAYPSGESRAAFLARVRRGIDRMLSLRREGTSLIVAHRGVIRAITHTLSGAEPVIELGSIQILAANADRWTNELLDFTAHLDGLG